MDWRIKGVIQKVLSTVPFGMKVNDVLQRTIGDLKNFDGQIADKVEDWAIHMGHLNKLGEPLEGKRLMEIGTGWFPTFPLCYALAGADAVVTFDLDRHLDQRLTFRLLRGLEPHLGTIADSAGRPLEDVRAAWERLSKQTSLADVLAEANIQYYAPADATKSGLSEESVDVVFSNSVLEHVPPDVLKRLTRESQRVLRSGGLIVHSINCGDHYAYFDKNINFMNYLQFTEEEWSFWNNHLQYQNRLRPQHFIDDVLSAGFQMEICIFNARQELLDALETMTVAPEFREYPPEQLASKSIDIVARKV